MLILVQAFRGIRINGAPHQSDRRGGPARVTGAHADHRVLPVPDGLAGERVDAAMARMFGLSRTRAAELIAAGHVQVDGADVGKSDRVLPGRGARRARSRRPADPLVVSPEIVEGIKIIHDDDSIVVIDKPVGVAVHPSPGLVRARPSSATSPAPASGSPPAAPPSGRASSSASTSAPPA